MLSLDENISPENQQATRLDDDLKRIRDAKYDVTLESNVCNWIGEIIGKPRSGNEPAATWLKSGDVLCSLINCIRPGTIKKYNPNTTSKFKQMENITLFLRACRELGMLEKDLFATVDLFEGKGMNSVILTLFNLGGTIQSTIPYFNGPKLGIKQSNAKFQVVPPLVQPPVAKVPAPTPVAPAAPAPAPVAAPVPIAVAPITDPTPVVVEQAVIEPVPLPQPADEPTPVVPEPVQTAAPAAAISMAALFRPSSHAVPDMAVSRALDSVAAVLSPPMRAATVIREDTPLATVASVKASRAQVPAAEAVRSEPAAPLRAPLSPVSQKPDSDSLSKRETLPSSRPPIPTSPLPARLTTAQPNLVPASEFDIKPRRRGPLTSNQIITSTKSAAQVAPMAQPTAPMQQMPALPRHEAQAPAPQLIYAAPPVMAQRPMHPAAMGSYQGYGSNLLRQVSSSSMAAANQMRFPAPMPARRRHIVPVNESDEAIEQAAVEWIEAVLNEAKPLSFSVHHWLRTGEVLCRLANVILTASPNPNIRITSIARSTDTILQQRENGRRFVDICRALGVSERDTFTTAELFEGRAMKQVANCVYCLGGILQNYEWWVNSPFSQLGKRLRIQSVQKV